MDINTDNYELYLLQYQEGTLSQEERRAVEIFLAQHPELQEEMALYDPSLRLVDNSDVHYPGLIPTAAAPVKRTLSPWWRRVAVACLLLALCGTGLVWTLHRNDNDTTLAALPQQNAVNALNPTVQEAPVSPQQTSRVIPPQTKAMSHENSNPTSLSTTADDSHSEQASVSVTMPEEVPDGELVAEAISTGNSSEEQQNGSTSTNTVVICNDLITYVDPAPKSVPRALDHGLRLSNKLLASGKTVGRFVATWKPRIEGLRDSISAQLASIDIFS